MNHAISQKLPHDENVIFKVLGLFREEIQILIELHNRGLEGKVANITKL